MSSLLSTTLTYEFQLETLSFNKLEVKFEAKQHYPFMSMQSFAAALTVKCHPIKRGTADGNLTLSTKYISQN